MDAEQVRIFGAILEDARDAHRLAVEMVDSTESHSALGGEGEDEACMRCGHINEAEYALAEAEAAL